MKQKRTNETKIVYFFHFKVAYVLQKEEKQDVKRGKMKKENEKIRLRKEKVKERVIKSKESQKRRRNKCVLILF
jgi:hypothetical protein